MCLLSYKRIGIRITSCTASGAWALLGWTFLSTGFLWIHSSDPYHPGCLSRYFFGRDFSDSVSVSGIFIDVKWRRCAPIFFLPNAFTIPITLHSERESYSLSPTFSLSPTELSLSPLSLSQSLISIKVIARVLFYFFPLSLSICLSVCPTTDLPSVSASCSVTRIKSLSGILPDTRHQPQQQHRVVSSFFGACCRCCRCRWPHLPHSWCGPTERRRRRERGPR